MALAPGDVLAGFRIEGLAGRGGMGVVHRATQLGLDRPVALKVITEALAADPGFRDRFVRESRAAASIDHPNVIPIYSAGEADGVLYLAMRLVDGPDLRTLVRAQGPLAPARAASLAAQVGAALDAAHERGIVHRDVKPANVLVTTSAGGDHAYLTDFGLTKRLGSATGTTRQGGWVGTLGYVAPEQIRSDRVDARTDVYALGCVLHFALTGEAPYRGEGDEALLFGHLEAPAPRPSDAGAPPAFDAVVARALSKDPAARFPSAGDLGRAALAAAGRGEVLPERTVARGAAAPGGADAATVVPAAAGAPGAGDAVRPAGPPWGAGPPAGATAATSAAPGRRPVWPWALAGVPVAGLALWAALVLGGDGPSATMTRPTTTSTAERTAQERAPMAADRALAVNGRPNDVLFAGGRLNVLRVGTPRVAELRGGTLGAGAEVGPDPTALAVGFDRLWVANGRPAGLTALRLAGGRADGTTVTPGVPGMAVDVAAGEGAVWLGVRGRPGYVVKIDPRSRRVLKTIAIPEGVQNLAVGYDAVWVTARRGNLVVRIGVADAGQQRITVGAEPRVVATGADGVWVANAGDDTVTRIDPGSQVTERIGVGNEPYGVAVGEGAVFVTNRIDDSVTRIDPRTREVVGELKTGVEPAAIDVAGRSVYVASPPDRTVYRLRYRR